MTTEEKRIAQEMYLAGKTIVEIAKEMHYCRETISRNLPAGLAKKGRKLKGIVYPGLANWMAVNGVTIADFNIKVCGKNNMYMSEVLHGNVSPTKKKIDKILAITGLTYEEAFRTAEDVKTHE